MWPLTGGGQARDEGTGFRGKVRTFLLTSLRTGMEPSTGPEFEREGSSLRQWAGISQIIGLTEMGFKRKQRTWERGVRSFRKNGLRCGTHPDSLSWRRLAFHLI